jgi:flavin reductase (DIM6/NTAB) family NADH-FMN oxidoreductase RutF
MDADVTLAFRRAMQQRADTVHLITYRSPAGHIEGMTATAVSALSLAPPSVLVCINQAARAREAIRTSRTFGVSILRDNQQAIAVDGALAGGEKSFDAELTIESDPTLTPVLRTALATLQCTVVDVRDLYTHTVFVGEVLVALTPNPGGPLLHHQGSYATVAEKGVR